MIVCEDFPHCPWCQARRGTYPTRESFDDHPKIAPCFMLTAGEARMFIAACTYAPEHPGLQVVIKRMRDHLKAEESGS